LCVCVGIEYVDLFQSSLQMIGPLFTQPILHDLITSQKKTGFNICNACVKRLLTKVPSASL
jgi:hypothetical protein